MDSTSISLLRRLKAADSAAWERFVELYAPLIFYWARNSGLKPPDANDLVQDVLTELVVKLPDFDYDPTKRFRAWLRTVTRNRAVDFQRRRARRESPRQSVPQVARMPSNDVFEEVEYRKFVVSRALEIMRGEFREEIWRACWLQVVEGQKAADVAAQLNLTINMAYLAKSRVLGRLREELDGLLD